jgi:hypothetical protein
MLSPAKADIVRGVKIPAWMRDDPHEGITQEEYTARLLRATESLCLSVKELDEMAADRLSKSEHWAIITGA